MGFFGSGRWQLDGIKQFQGGDTVTVVSCVAAFLECNIRGLWPLRSTIRWIYLIIASGLFLDRIPRRVINNERAGRGYPETM
jgi:hypothetical protein